VRDHPRIIRATPAGLALAVGIGIVAGGCGGGTGSGADSEKMPEGFAVAKEAMKERAAAAKKGRPGAPARAPGGQ
jgi:hypothetical protein